MAERQFDGVKLSVAFSQAANLENISSGENIATSFGKISKMYASLITKIGLGDVFGTNATLLDNTKNIDTITTQGLYFWTQSSKPTNLPKRKLVSTESTLTQGLLFVFRPTNYASIVQIIVPINVYNADGWSIYIRTSTSTSLSSVDWHLIESTAEFDTSPVQNSTNGITSGAIFNIVNALGTAALADATTTVEALSPDLPSSGAVYTAISTAVSNAVNALDVSDITANLSESKTITALSETDGKIAATASSIQISESQVTNLTTDLASKMSASDVFGLGTQITTAGSFSGDLDNVKTAGCYYWVDTDIPAHSPMRGNVSTNGAVENASIYVIKNAYGNRYTQIVIPQGYVVNAFGLYIRNSYSSSGVDTWTNWIYLEPTSHYDTTPTTDSTNACTSGGIASALSGKQDSITFDGTYNSSSNPAATVSTVTSAVSSKQDTLTFDGTYDASTNKAATQTTVSDAITALNLGTAATRGVTTSITSGSTSLLTSGGAYTNVPKISLRRGTNITSSSSSRANLNDYTTAGRYYTNNAASTYTIQNSPLDAMGVNISNGKVMIDGTEVTFNGTMELVVEELSSLVSGGTTTAEYICQTLKYSYNSSGTGTAVTIGRNFARSRYFKRVKDYAGWSNWYEYVGTEIVPASSGTNNLNDPMGGLGNEDI